jgi:AcrR family transcriptional regulator
MPRPRFESLEPERRAAILAAAAGEMAECGLDGASYNRIIRRAGVSKGAMYYYFDDKTDLCATVLREAADRAYARIGPPTPFADAHGFWDSLEDFFARILRFVVAEPDLAPLIRRLLGAPGADASPPVAELLDRLRSDFAGLLERGFEVGAVRTDLPLELLVAVAFAVGEASDRWLLRALAPLDLVEAREGRTP